jgi:tetraprenyl-beta-curcumene synthase
VNATTTRWGGVRGHPGPAAAPHGVWRVSRTRGGVGLAAAFSVAAVRYWGFVFPRVCRELSWWRGRAKRIADPTLQRLALEALQKQGNVEGAAAFAAFVPRAHRRAAIRALSAFQLTYDYVDLLAEQPSRDPVANARSLHGALLVALEPGAAHLDYYAHGDRRADSGYLEELVDSCRGALAQLPSHAAVASAAGRTAARIVAFQGLSMGGRGDAAPCGRRDVGDPDVDAGGQDVARRASVGAGDDGFATLRRCAREQTPAGTGLRWWETAAAGGSSLGALALIAAAAEPAIDPREVAAIEDAYFPWIGACHSLLDSLVDREEDARIGQLSLIGCYADSDDAAARIGWIAAQAMRHARELPRGCGHAVLFAGMAGFYLSAPQAAASTAQPICREVEAALGPLARPTLSVFDLRRRLAGRRAGRGRRDADFALQSEREAGTRMPAHW